MAAAAGLNPAPGRGAGSSPASGTGSCPVGPVEWTPPRQGGDRRFESGTGRMALETDIAWAAGLLEGEGSFLQKSTRKTILVTCQMTDLDVLQRLQRIFGGSIYATAKVKAHHKDSWRWQVIGVKAAETMELVKPYMLSRRSLAIEVALDSWYQKQDEIASRRRQSQAAGRAYLAGEGTLREVAQRFNISYEAVRQAAFRET